MFKLSLTLVAAAIVMSSNVSPSMAQMAQQDTQAGAQRSENSSQRKVSEYFERDVYLADGTEVGEIEDLVVDSSNRITAAIVEIESGMGIGERRVAIPLDRLTVTSDRLILDMSPEQLTRLPAYDPQ